MLGDSSRRTDEIVKSQTAPFNATIIIIIITTMIEIQVNGQIRQNGSNGNKGQQKVPRRTGENR